MDSITRSFKPRFVSPINLCCPSNTGNNQRVFFLFNNYPLSFEYLTSRKFCSTAITHARKKNSKHGSPVRKPTIIEEISEDEDEDVDVDEDEDDDVLVIADFDDGILSTISL